MNNEPDHTRRWLIGAGGAAVLANALPISPATAQTTAAPEHPPAVSSIATTLSDYVAKTLDRPLPEPVIAATKLHLLDTIAAMVSGSRLKPGDLAARYVDSLGGRPQAMVIGTGLVTSVVNATFANAIMAQSDETDDTNTIGPVHIGCCAVPAALATAEFAGRTGADVLRAVALGYDIGTGVIESLGIYTLSPRFAPSCLPTTFIAAATSAALLRLDPRQVRHTFSYATQQSSGTSIWQRDSEHVEKAFDFAGMGTRNGVMAVTMVAFGFTGVEDPFSGNPNFFSALADKATPEKLIAGLGSKFSITSTTIKKWSVGAPLQSVLDAVSALLDDPAVRAENIKSIAVEVPAYSLAILDNTTTPDLSVRHLVALMIVDHGASFTNVHDVARMSDPRVLAVRRLVELVPNKELDVAKPERQAIVRIETIDGRSLSHHTVVVRGTAENPMDAKEVEAKALDLMAPVLGAGRAQDVIAAIRTFESFGPVVGLRRLLT